MWESGFERDWLVAKGLQLRERARALGERDIARQADGWGALPYFDASSSDLAAGALQNMELELDTLEAEIESLERGKLFGKPPITFSITPDVYKSINSFNLTSIWEFNIECL